MKLFLAIIFSIIFLVLLVVIIVNKVSVSKIKKTGAIVIENFDFYMVPMIFIYDLLIVYFCWGFVLDMSGSTEIPLYFLYLIFLFFVSIYEVLKAARRKIVFSNGKFEVLFIIKKPYSFTVDDIESVSKKRPFCSINYETYIFLKNGEKIVIEKDAIIFEELFNKKQSC